MWHNIFLSGKMKYHRYIGVWRSWLARSVRDAEVGGSSPLTPTICISKIAPQEGLGSNKRHLFGWRFLLQKHRCWEKFKSGLIFNSYK